QDLVQRLLYVLTYFIRCSELLETHMLDSVEDEAIVMPGSLITTSLRKGEVEESDYVLVTVHKPSGDYLSQGAHCQQIEAEDSSYRSDNSLQSSTYTDMGVEHSSSEPPKEEDEEEEVEEAGNLSTGSRSSVLQSRPTEDTIAQMRTAATAEPRELQRELSGPLLSEVPVETVLRVCSATPRKHGSVLETETKGDLKLVDSSLPSELALHSSISSVTVDCKKAEAEAATSVGSQASKMQSLWPSGISLEKKPPDKNSAGAMAVPVLPGNIGTGPMALAVDEEPATKVTFLIGDSMSPESDTESRRRKMEVELKKHKQYYMQRGAYSKTINICAAEDQTNQTKATPALQWVSSKIPQWSSKCEDYCNDYLNSENHLESRTINNQETDSMHKHLLNPSGISQLHELGDHSFPSAPSSPGLDISLSSSRKGDSSSVVQRRCRCSSTGSSDTCCCRNCPAEQCKDPRSCVPLRQDGDDGNRDQKCQTASVNEWEIPRNESSDSALGDSESEETEDWQEEVLVPFPGAKLVENYSKPTIANFGRSLFGGYCPTYVPDFVLHGIPSDEKLRPSLMTELNHAVQVKNKRYFSFPK
ncbi:hypothetical protein XENOCAPTIV_009809, partial [Xenoophorus captivus]